MDVMHCRGYYHRRYTQRETDRLFRPVLNRIFIPFGHPDSFANLDPGPNLFRNPDWKVFAGFCDPWGGDYSGPPLEESDPRNVHFQNPCTELWEPLRPLFNVLAEQEIDEIVHMGTQLPEPDTDDFDSLDGSVYGAVTSPPLGAATAFAHMQHPAFIFGDGYIFSRDGRWGLLGSVDEFYVCGGEPALIDRVYELAGGTDTMNDAFCHHFRTLYRNDLWRPNLPMKSVILGMCKLSGWEPLPEMLDLDY